jgi:hypothetical protein
MFVLLLFRARDLHRPGVCSRIIDHFAHLLPRDIPDNPVAVHDLRGFELGRDFAHGRNRRVDLGPVGIG